MDLTAEDAANQAPTAAFTSSCINRTCVFDTTGSSDPDGTIASYTWDFGDGDDGHRREPDTRLHRGRHGLGRLFVTDDDAANSPDVVHDVSPADPPASDIAFRASATASINVGHPAGHRARRR